jgi:hypothetical protein
VTDAVRSIGLVVGGALGWVVSDTVDGGVLSGTEVPALVGAGVVGLSALVGDGAGEPDVPEHPATSTATTSNDGRVSTPESAMNGRCNAIGYRQGGDAPFETVQIVPSRSCVSMERRVAAIDDIGSRPTLDSLQRALR